MTLLAKFRNFSEFMIFWVIVATLSIVLFAAEYFVLSAHTLQFGETVLNLGLIIFLFQVLYTVAGFRIVGPTELGARLFLGKPINNLTSGLVFIPPGICQLSKGTRLTIEDELPADPQHIYRVKRGEPEVVPPELVGIMFPPIRIPFGHPDEPSDDPLDVRITAEVVPIVRWRIVNYIQFLTTIGSREEARRQMEDIMITVLMREFSKVTPAAALKDLEKYGKLLKSELRDLVADTKSSRPWGIEIAIAEVKSIIFSHELSVAILKVPEATLEAKATIIEAEAQRKKLELEGKGEGAKERETLKGRTTGLKKMMTELELKGPAVLGAETARAITQNPGQKTVVVGASGFKELIGIADAAGSVMKNTEEKGGAS